MNGLKKNSLTGLLFGLVMFLAATTAVALSCVDANSETVTYDVAEIRIDGEVAEMSELDEDAMVYGTRDDTLWMTFGDDEWTTELSFTGGDQ